MKEARKIYIDNNVWQGLIKIAELEGVSIGDLITKMFMDKYAWKIEVPKPTPKNNIKEIKELLLKGADIANIPKDEYHLYYVLYCKECVYLSIVHRYSISPWTCLNEHKMVKLGTLNEILGGKGG
jgi:predicted nucleic-acid-binding Zn-ribbon protein